jgi:hypothetical protein
MMICLLVMTNVMNFWFHVGFSQSYADFFTQSAAKVYAKFRKAGVILCSPLRSSGAYAVASAQALQEPVEYFLDHLLRLLQKQYQQINILRHIFNRGGSWFGIIDYVLKINLVTAKVV